jgi:hypothetical protein
LTVGASIKNIELSSRNQSRIHLTARKFQFRGYRQEGRSVNPGTAGGLG